VQLLGRPLPRQISDPLVRDFWREDFSRHMPEREQRERTLSTLNKVRQFLDDPMLRNIVAQRSAFDLAEVIDSSRIFVANLATGRMGQDNSALLGAFLISGIHSAALARKKARPLPYPCRRGLSLRLCRLRRDAFDLAGLRRIFGACKSSPLGRVAPV